MGCFSREWYDISIGVSILTATSFRNVFFFKVSRNVRRRRIDLSPRGTEDRPNPLVFDHRSERRELAIEEQRMGNRWTKMLRTLIQKKISKESKRRFNVCPQAYTHKFALTHSACKLTTYKPNSNEHMNIIGTVHVVSFIIFH